MPDKMDELIRNTGPDPLSIACAKAARENKNYHVGFRDEGVEISFEEGRDGFVQAIIQGRYFFHKFKIYPREDGNPEGIQLEYDRETVGKGGTWKVYVFHGKDSTAR